MTDAERIAAFLAAKGVTVVAPGLAYGVDAAADKVKRAAERERHRHEASEQHSERRMERVREAYHTGGRRAATEALDD